jgi:hypothetical protein
VNDLLHEVEEISPELIDQIVFSANKHGSAVHTEIDGPSI